MEEGDDDDNATSIEEASSDASIEVDAVCFLVKHHHDKGTSISPVDLPDLPKEEVRREKHQKLYQDPAANTAALPTPNIQNPTVPRPTSNTSFLMAPPRKVRAKPTESM